MPTRRSSPAMLMKIRYKTRFRTDSSSAERASTCSQHECIGRLARPGGFSRSCHDGDDDVDRIDPDHAVAVDAQILQPLDDLVRRFSGDVAGDFGAVRADCRPDLTHDVHKTSGESVRWVSTASTRSGGAPINRRCWSTPSVLPGSRHLPARPWWSVGGGGGGVVRCGGGHATRPPPRWRRRRGRRPPRSRVDGPREHAADAGTSSTRVRRRGRGRTASASRVRGPRPGGCGRRPTASPPCR